MTDHARARELAAAALDFELSAEDRAELRDHLAGCAQCHVYNDGLDRRRPGACRAAGHERARRAAIADRRRRARRRGPVLGPSRVHRAEATCAAPADALPPAGRARRERRGRGGPHRRHARLEVATGDGGVAGGQPVAGRPDGLRLAIARPGWVTRRVRRPRRSRIARCQRRLACRRRAGPGRRRRGRPRTRQQLPAHEPRRHAAGRARRPGPGRSARGPGRHARARRQRRPPDTERASRSRGPSTASR